MYIWTISQLLAGNSTKYGIRVYNRDYSSLIEICNHEINYKDYRYVTEITEIIRYVTEMTGAKCKMCNGDIAIMRNVTEVIATKCVSFLLTIGDNDDCTVYK
jgi:hypothetical protein